MTKNCDWCGNNFEANVSYQIYCTSDCRTEATKEKNLIKQREKRIKSRVGKERPAVLVESHYLFTMTTPIAPPASEIRKI